MWKRELMSSFSVKKNRKKTYMRPGGPIPNKSASGGWKWFFWGVDEFCFIVSEPYSALLMQMG